MDRAGLLEFIRRRPLAVVTSVTPEGAPQAALVGIAATDTLELVFDTLGSTRKAHNLRQNPRIALVIGWDNEQTLQCEGLADEPRDEALIRLKSAYFATFPDGPGRQTWPGITYFRVRLTWARYSDYSRAEPLIVEFDRNALVPIA